MAQALAAPPPARPVLKVLRSPRRGMLLQKKITGFHQDEEAQWVARLECGHQRPMRHNPPWIRRPWVLTPEGRHLMMGQMLNCVDCDEREAAARANSTAGS